MLVMKITINSSVFFIKKGTQMLFCLNFTILVQSDNSIAHMSFTHSTHSHQQGYLNEHNKECDKNNL